MSAMDHPEPVEPPVALLPDGDVYCLVHGQMNCSEPWCWKCGSHLMDDFERCADPRCRATNDETARAIVEHLKALDEWRWRPVPIELIALEIGRAHRDNPFPSFQPGEPGGGGESEPPSTAGAGSTWDGADDRD